MKLEKYKQNLDVRGDKVFSYDTHVATIDWAKRQLLVYGHWSMTTSKHTNYVAKEYRLSIVQMKKSDREETEQESSGFDAIKMICAFGDIFCTEKKEQNDWKKRMLNAGLGNQGLSFPDDWDTLSEEEKERRLSGAINNL